MEHRHTFVEALVMKVQGIRQAEQCRCKYFLTSVTSFSSSVGATARCELWPVEQYLSICPYLSPSLSIFSLPALEDLFPLLLSILSWVFLFVSSLPVLEWGYFWDILSSSILSRWRSQLILCPFIHFTISYPLLSSSSSRFVLLFRSPSSYLGPYIPNFSHYRRYSYF